MALLLDSLTGFSELKRKSASKSYDDNDVTNIVQRIVQTAEGGSSKTYGVIRVNQRHLYELLDLPFNILTSLLNSGAIDRRIAILSLCCALKSKIIDTLTCKSVILNTLCCFIALEFDNSTIDSEFGRAFTAALIHFLILLSVTLQGCALKNCESFGTYGLAVLLSYATLDDGKVLLIFLRMYDFFLVVLLTWPFANHARSSYSFERTLQDVSKPLFMFLATGLSLLSFWQPFSYFVMTWPFLKVSCVVYFAVVYFHSKSMTKVNEADSGCLDVTLQPRPSFLLMLREVCFLRKYMRTVLMDLDFPDQSPFIRFNYQQQTCSLEIIGQHREVSVGRVRRKMKSVFAFVYFVTSVFSLVVVPYLCCFFMSHVVPLVSCFVIPTSILLLVAGIYSWF